jgi:hypothetical protein
MKCIILKTFYVSELINLPPLFNFIYHCFKHIRLRFFPIHHNKKLQNIYSATFDIKKSDLYLNNLFIEEMSLKLLKIEATKSSPEICMNPEGVIEISGRSMSEDFTGFYKQIEVWINNYISNPPDSTRFDFYLEYLNTTNIKFYISILKKIEAILLRDKKLAINWYYEEGDEDIFEKGEYISGSLKTRMSFKMLKEGEIKRRASRSNEI